MRLIDSDALEKRMEDRLCDLRTQFGRFDHYTDGFEEGCVAVEDAETIEAEPVRHERWELRTIPDVDWYSSVPAWFCTGCGFHVQDKSRKPKKLTFGFCPNCGAKMDGDGE